MRDRGDGYFRNYFDCRCHKSIARIVYIIGEAYRGCSKRRSGWDGRGAYLSGGEGGEGDRDSAKGGSLIDVDMTYERGGKKDKSSMYSFAKTVNTDHKMSV